MNRATLASSLFITLILGGCSSASQQIVGTWKGDPVPVETPKEDKKRSEPGKDIASAFAEGMKGLVNAFVGPVTIEFNADGKYKLSLSMGSVTGTYSVNGKEVTLKPDADQKTNINLNSGKFIISDDGKTLRSKQEFKSDSVLELKKQA